MTTITRERIEQALENPTKIILNYGDTLELARIALASLEAGPVGEVVLGEYDDFGCHPDARVACIAADGQADWENFKDGTRLYAAPPSMVVIDERAAFNAWNNDENLPIAGVGAKNAAWLGWQARAKLIAPPAPVSVPDDVLKGLLPDAEKAEFWFEHNGKILFEGVKFNNAVFDACRAAMLQGADGNSPAHSGCRPAQNCISPAQCGNSPVIPDGWVMVPEEPTHEMLEAGDEQFGTYDVYRRMIEAAPKLE